MGESCDKAVALLIMRDGEGLPVSTFSPPAFSLLSLSWAGTAAEMNEALVEWIDGGATYSAKDLPEWPGNQEYPAAEFWFVPDAGMGQPSYEQMRADDDTIWCHIQCKESAACLLLNENYADLVGYERFPG